MQSGRRAAPEKEKNGDYVEGTRGRARLDTGQKRKGPGIGELHIEKGSLSGQIRRELE